MQCGPSWFFTPRQLSYIGDQITAIEMGGACGTNGSEEKCVRDLVQKLEGKDRYLKPICRWDNIKMDLKNMGKGDVDWIDVAEDKDKWQSLVDTVMNLRVPQIAGNCLISWGTKFSRTLFDGIIYQWARGETKT